MEKNNAPAILGEDSWSSFTRKISFMMTYVRWH